ncbi:MAG: outer membrane beta-barrel protein, partial [Rhizobiales bacterium]|nr:outer membrane beta-barrel protein [Hyphomicrobiales bacterium]
MRRRRPVAVSFAAILWLAAGGAYGQEVPDLRPSVGEMEQVAAAPLKRKPTVDPHAPVGVRTGGIIAYPSITVGSVVTSNVREASSGAEAAIGSRLQPALRFESDWARHSFTGQALYDRIDYFDHSDLTEQRADIFSKFRLDIRALTRAEFEAAYNLDQSGLADSDVPASAVGFRTEHRINTAAALIHDFGPLETRLKAGAGLQIYDDVKLSGGGREDNADRDYATPSLSLRATYTDPPMLQPYVQAAYDPRYYLRKRDRDGFKRSSQGLGVSAGVVIDRGPFWSGDLAAIYLWRDYDDQALDSNTALGLDGSLMWRPNELTRIVLAFGTSLEDSVSTTSSSNRNWTGRIDLTHGLR